MREFLLDGNDTLFYGQISDSEASVVVPFLTNQSCGKLVKFEYSSSVGAVMRAVTVLQFRVDILILR